MRFLSRLVLTAALVTRANDRGVEYVVLDEGWYKLGNVLDVVPEINVGEIVEHVRRKNVGVILWVVWKTLEDQLEPALEQFERWGVKGIKGDFMQRDDQPVVNFYHRLCREAAGRRMLVDFHGAQRPRPSPRSGTRRACPTRASATTSSSCAGRGMSGGWAQ